MNYFKTLTAAFLAVILPALVSCSEDESPNSSNNNDTYDTKAVDPMFTVGNYWVFNDYYVYGEDEQLNIYHRQQKNYGTTTYLDKECFQFPNTSGSTNWGTVYERLEGSEFWLCNGHYLGNVFTNGNYSLYGKPCWIKTADFSKTEWECYEHIFDNESVGYNAVMNGKLRMHGEFGEIKKITVNDVEYEAVTIINYFDWSGTIEDNGEEYSFPEPYHRITFWVWYAPNVGMLGWEYYWPPISLGNIQEGESRYRSRVVDFYIEEE